MGLSTSDVVAIAIGAVLLLAGLLPAVWALRLATRQLEAAMSAERLTRNMFRDATMLTVSASLRQIQLAVLADEKAAAMITGAGDDGGERRKKTYVSLLLSFYADIFDLRTSQDWALPDHIWEMHRADLAGIMKQPAFAARWREIRDGFPVAAFRSLVDGLAAEEGGRS
jgi:hypothetical protein